MIMPPCTCGLCVFCVARNRAASAQDVDIDTPTRAEEREARSRTAVRDGMVNNLVNDVREYCVSLDVELLESEREVRRLSARVTELVRSVETFRVTCASLTAEIKHLESANQPYLGVP